VTLLVVRLGALGDIVHTVPAVAAILRSLPGTRIDWLVERKHRPVLDLFDLDVRPIAIEGGSVGAFLGAMRGLRANGYDVALDFQGLLKSAILARGSGARRVVGFSRDALREPMAGRFYTEDVTPGTAQHVIAKNLALVRAVGVESDEIRVPLKRPSEERSNERLALLNPGAGWPNKQWPADRFGAVAAGLRRSRNLRSVVTWGPGEEPLARAVVDSSGGAAELAPATSLPHLMTLLASAALVVSGDTGPIHLAAAAGTPIVGLYGPTDPARNGPWSVSDVTVSRFSECVCHHKRRCHRATRCLDDITVEDVLAAAEARLDRAAGTGA
jgi:lipopolysaccharide heptosyltransferase I